MLGFFFFFSFFQRCSIFFFFPEKEDEGQKISSLVVSTYYISNSSGKFLVCELDIVSRSYGHFSVWAPNGRPNFYKTEKTHQHQHLFVGQMRCTSIEGYNSNPTIQSKSKSELYFTKYAQDRFLLQVASNLSKYEAPKRGRPI